MWFVAEFALNAQAASPTAQELVAQNLVARGGKDALGAITSLQETGRMRFGGGSTTMDWSALRSGRAIRQEVTTQGLTAVSAYDGKDAWQTNPFGGRKEPDHMSADDAKGMIEEAPIEGILLSANAAGYPITYVGIQEFEGTSALRLRVDRPGGDVDLVDLDPDSFLEIRVVSRHTDHGAIVESETDYSDYEKVGGVYFPLLVEFGGKDQPASDRVKIEVEHATPNVPIPAGAFAFPKLEKR